MNTIDKLENSVQAFIEVYEKVRAERMKTSEDSIRCVHELEKAREKIKELQQAIENLEKNQERCKEIDVRKNQIKEQIALIINNLSKLSN